MSWYFAYGSNMQSETLRGRRNVVWRRAVAARAPGWRVVFDKPPLFAIGCGFANLIADPTTTALGVAFELDDAELAHIELTEGVAIGNYARVAIAIEPLATVPDPPTTAFTLATDKRDPTLQPSTRYMALLIAGAIEHELPADYVALLRAVPACEESAQAQELRPMIDRLMGKRAPR